MTDDKTDLKAKLQQAQKEADAKEKKALEKFEEEDLKTAEIEKLKQDLEEITEVSKRLMADMQNMKRREQEERMQTIVFANAELMKSLLPVLDNFERIEKHAPENISEDLKQWYEGILISTNQFKKALTDAGLKVIETVGKPFNPDLHEALAQSPGEKDMVLEELEKGYTLEDRVLRHAKVRIGNGEK